MDFELKVWWLILIVFTILITNTIIKKISISKPPILPEKIKSYVSDSFTNWNWKWNWNWDSKKNKWTIIDLWPYCKNCDIKLLNKSSMFESAMQCPKCKTRFESMHMKTDDYDSVKAVIYDNVEKNRI